MRSYRIFYEDSLLLYDSLNIYFQLPKNRSVRVKFSISICVKCIIMINIPQEFCDGLQSLMQHEYEQSQHEIVNPNTCAFDRNLYSLVWCFCRDTIFEFIADYTSQVNE